MVEFCLQIGPAIIRITAEHLPDGMNEPLFQPFLCEPRPVPTLDLLIRTDSPPEPESGVLLAECSDSWRIHPHGRGLRMDLLDPMDFRPKQVALLNADWSRADFYLLPHLFERFNRPHHLWYLGEVLEPFIQWWLTAWLARRGEGAILHSSAVVLEGRGLVFTAPSEGGKTTLARLFLEAGATVLNDERVVIWRECSGWKVGGTPWHGELRRVSSATAPLQRLCLLKKGLVNEFVPKPTTALLPHIIPEAFLPLWNAQAMTGLLEALTRLTEEVRCGELQFRRDASVIGYLREQKEPAELVLPAGQATR